MLRNRAITHRTDDGLYFASCVCGWSAGPFHCRLDGRTHYETDHLPKCAIVNDAIVLVRILGNGLAGLPDLPEDERAELDRLCPPLSDDEVSKMTKEW